MKPLVADIYHRNPVKSFKSAYDAGLRGLIHKASQGSHFQDPKFLQRKPEAEDAGFLYGAYHFADGSDVESQVKNFLKCVKYDGKTLLALDYEPSSKFGTMSISQAKKWLEMVYKETGQRPVIYSGHLLKEKIDDDSEFWRKHRLWLAHYSNKPTLPKHFDKYWIWQYTGDGRGPEPHKWVGFDGWVDLNVYHTDESLLEKEWAPSIGSSSRIIDYDPNGSVRELKDWTEIEKLDDLPNLPEAEDGKLPWMTLAKSLIGTDEAPGSRDNKTILSWARAIGLSNVYNHDSIPWCGLFVGYVVSQTGMDTSNAPLWALSWKGWGRDLDEPKYGCVLVFKRNGGGHVGFAVGQDSDYFHVLGGNQSDSVNISKIAKSRCVGYRWPIEYPLSLAKPLPHQSINASVTQNER